MHKTSLLALLTAATLVATPALAADKVQFGDQMVFPESITSTADGTLYAGSLTMGVIFKAAPGAAKADVFVQKPADGPQAIVGVYADEKTGLLWTCYADLAAFSGKGMPSVVRTISLADGSVKGSYSLPEASFCNDTVTTSDGTAYIADTAGSRIMRLKPGATALDEWAKGDLLATVDGISIGPDGKLYANGVQTGKLVRIDINADGSAGTMTDLKLSAPLMGPDGMRFGDDGKLYIAENQAGRVSAATFDGDAATITPIKDGFDGPTAVTKVGNTLWVLEAKIGKFGQQGVDPGQFFAYPVMLGM
jgi:sugar lactone lactonase YvrE